MLVYEKLAEMVAAEGTRCHFTLLGDANMYFSDALEQRGARTIHVRHEHCACSMAMSYALASGEVGFCSVTCGPGLTQLTTALPAAVRASIPMVVFAGESPLHGAWYNQQIDQAPLVRATSALYMPLHSVKLMPKRIQEAFLIARRERCPVVLGVPMDLQSGDWDGPDGYVPSREAVPQTGRMHPDPTDVEAVAMLIGKARRIVVVGGRGAYRADAGEACARLADACGALLATTLPAKGLFCGHPFDLGVCGGFSSSLAREMFGEADLVLAFGARLAQHMRDSGKLFGHATVVQIDSNPRGIDQGAVVAGHALRGDARICAEMLAEAISADEGDWRSDALAKRIATEPSDATEFPKDDHLDPRDVIAELDALIPKDWEVVNSSGHCSYFSAQMRGRKTRNFHVIREFGAIGNGLSYAMGVAAARPDNNVLLIDGDGSLMMHAQELDTVRRHGLRILICILNDGAYGSEIHKLRSEGMNDSGATHGRGDIGAVARGFGLKGQVVESLADLPVLLDAFNDHDGAELWDFHISDAVTSPVMRSKHPPKKQ